MEFERTISFFITHKGPRVMEVVDTIWGPMGLGEEAFEEIADYFEYQPDCEWSGS